MPRKSETTRENERLKKKMMSKSNPRGYNKCTWKKFFQVFFSSFKQPPTNFLLQMFSHSLTPTVSGIPSLFLSVLPPKPICSSSYQPYNALPSYNSLFFFFSYLSPQVLLLFPPPPLLWMSCPLSYPKTSL